MGVGVGVGVGVGAWVGATCVSLDARYACCTLDAYACFTHALLMFYSCFTHALPYLSLPGRALRMLYSRCACFTLLGTHALYFRCTNAAACGQEHYIYISIYICIYIYIYNIYIYIYIYIYIIHILWMR